MQMRSKEAAEWLHKQKIAEWTGTQMEKETKVPKCMMHQNPRIRHPEEINLRMPRRKNLNEKLWFGFSGLAYGEEAASMAGG